MVPGLGGDVTENGISKLVFTILSAVAEAGRDRIRERVTVVKADRRAHKSGLHSLLCHSFPSSPLSNFIGGSPVRLCGTAR